MWHTQQAIWSALCALRAGPVLDGQINPYHISFATKGFRIQHEIFKIPARYGVFSSSPPRLQAHEAQRVLMFLLVTMLHISTCAWLVWSCCNRPGANVIGASVLMAGWVITQALLLWALYVKSPASFHTSLYSRGAAPFDISVKATQQHGLLF